MLEFYRRMIALRRESEALRPGATRFFDTSEPVLAFSRGDAVIAVFNLSPGTHSVRLKGAGEAIVAQGAERRGARLKLHPNGFAIMNVAGRGAGVADA